MTYVVSTLQYVPEDHMALAFLRGHARKVCMAEQAEKVRIGGSGERWVEQVVGDVHHVLRHQVLFRLPCWVDKYINVGWLDRC